MSDSISREAVKSTIADIYTRCDTQNMMDYRNLLLECVDVLPSAESRWIPVAERLPETKRDGYWFFVTKEENEIYTNILKTEVCMTFFDEYNLRFNCSGRIKAWMPIVFPEPWKGEEK